MEITILLNSISIEIIVVQLSFYFENTVYVCGQLKCKIISNA